MGWGGKEKPAAEPLHLTKCRSSMNGRLLGITIGQSHVIQNDQCVTACQQMQRNDQIRSIMAVVEDNSLKFALQETA